MKAWCNERKIWLFCINKEKGSHVSGTWGGVQYLHEVKGEGQGAEGRGEMEDSMVKLRKLIIETEGSSAPQEIDVQRKKSSKLGNCWQLSYRTRGCTARAKKKREKKKVHPCPSLLPLLLSDQTSEHSRQETESFMVKEFHYDLWIVFWSLGHVWIWRGTGTKASPRMFTSYMCMDVHMWEYKYSDAILNLPQRESSEEL